MMKEDIEKLKKAFEMYNIDGREDLPNNILLYIYDRIKENKAEIEKLVEVNKKNLKFDEILKVIKKEIDTDIEPYGKTIINEQGFMFSQVLVPIGLIAVEAYEPLEIVKYWIKGIKTRNGVAVSSVEYDDQSIEALILVIIKEALSKYNLDENLVMYLSFEECFYEYFDKVFYTYDKAGNLLDNPRVEQKQVDLEQSQKKFVYIENEIFRLEAEKNENVEILTGNVDDVIEKIENAKAVSIYTQNSKIAFDFINLANCKNVFVNTSVENSVEIIESDNEFYKYKNIIVPVPREILDKKIIEKDNQNIELDTNNESNDNDLSEKEEKALVEYKENLWMRIKRRFKEIFRF